MVDETTLKGKERYPFRAVDVMSGIRHLKDAPEAGRFREASWQSFRRPKKKK
jgi:hypothetical protein